MNLQQAIWQDPARMSGTVCFRGTRIPVATLFVHLEHNELDQFYADFPDVTPEMVHAVLAASQRLVEQQAA